MLGEEISPSSDNLSNHLEGEIGAEITMHGTTPGPGLLSYVDLLFAIKPKLQTHPSKMDLGLLSLAVCSFPQCSHIE